MKAILFRPQGNLDLKGSCRLKQIVDKIILQSQNLYWIIDLAFVNQINNFGLTTLVVVHKIAKTRGCKLYLLNLQDDLEVVFQITGLDQKFNVLEDEKLIGLFKPKLLLC